jgi:NADPH:quinone reductase-like Zn-dependent oxidoreductase
MKAAILFQKGEMPKYAETPDPIIENENELLITMKAAAIKHIDKSRASGKHYSTAGDINQAQVIGGDGVGLLKDGTRVYAIGVSGMIAEKAVVEKNRMVPLPAGIDDITAAALPNAVIGSAMAIRFKAGVKPGETVLINGATGFTGRISVQVARYYGATKIIVTGRNEKSLQELLDMGADEIISLNQSDESFVAQLKNIHNHSPVDVVLDYLWGHSAELIFLSLKGKGAFTHKTKFVSIGSVTGDIVQLSAENLRSVDLQLSGSGLGSWTKEQMQELFHEILPEMFQLAADKKLKVDTIAVSLKDIEKLWEMDVPAGKRIVVAIH